MLVSPPSGEHSEDGTELRACTSQMETNDTID